MWSGDGRGREVFARTQNKGDMSLSCMAVWAHKCWGASLRKNATAIDAERDGLQPDRNMPPCPLLGRGSAVTQYIVRNAALCATAFGGRVARGLF